VLAGHSRLNAESYDVCFGFYDAVAQCFFEIFFKSTCFIGPHHFKWKDSFTWTNVLALNIIIRFTGDFVICPSDLEEFVDSKWMLASENQTVNVAFFRIEKGAK